jgi:hypothetical protein
MSASVHSILTSCHGSLVQKLQSILFYSQSGGRIILQPYKAIRPSVNIQTTHASIRLSIPKALDDRKLSIVYLPNVLSSSKMNGYLS